MPMIDKEFIDKAGTVCPVCESERITGDIPEPIGSELTVRDMRCNDCDSTWCEKYRLYGYDIDSQGE